MHAYNGRGKSMTEILTEKAKKFNYVAKPDDIRSNSAVKKNSKPGPGSYKVEESLDRSASSKRAYRHVIPKAKNINYISKSALR